VGKPAGRLAPAHLKLLPKIKVAFASGTDDLNAQLIAHMRELFPELPLYVVAEFPPTGQDIIWVRYRVNRGFVQNWGENWARCRAAFHGKSIRLAGVMLVPSVPYRQMRLLAFLLAPLGFLAFNENLNHWMLRPRCAWTIVRHFAWRARNFLRWHFGRDGTLRRRDWGLDLWHLTARLAGRLRFRRARASALPPGSCPAQAISVIIPSRNGKDLLASQLPGIARDLPTKAEIIVVDNGSDDGTCAWLNAHWPQVRIEQSAQPLSFAAAINRGLALAPYARVCLLNNDMLIEPGFFTALEDAFTKVPYLFCATAQIRFPPGIRREETGKAVMAQAHPTDFPVRCDEPLPGEDLTYVLYGSGGCSLYDTEKLRALGGIDETYAPAYVEDLDLGYRAWQRGWPSVYVAGAVVEHRHRATTSRYYTEQELTRILERNYLQFLARAVWDSALFRRLWKQALHRLRLVDDRQSLEAATKIALSNHRPPKVFGHLPEADILALTNGSISVFPGRAATGKPRVLIASPYLPFPLSHGGAVRIYNLMRRAAAEFDQVLVVFTESLEPPAPEILDIAVETVLVRRAGSHSLPFTGRPDVVEEFASASFRAALIQTVRKWQPAVAQLEFTQMAQYSQACSPARTLLVEHDVTFDLYEQLLALEENWDLRRQLALWRQFESRSWRAVDGVIVMSEKDRAVVSGTRAITLPNGVDFDRFQPSPRPPEPGRLLFIGSFAHLPNLLATEFFLNQVWPHLQGATLHIIAGARHDYHLARAADRVKLKLNQPGVELEGFVSDVRPAYERAAVVVAPLVASAGTNIKILEAMAMGKAIVSTPAGVNGLDLVPGDDFVLAKTAAEMADAIGELLSDLSRRRRFETAARRRAEDDYGWDQIAYRQALLYRKLL
jgi:GT2 family glycosyltransferase/glycosyltransferase involved in cell wall biosynthesis